MDRHGHNCEILLYTQFSNEHFFLCVFLQIVDLLSYNLDVGWDGDGSDNVVWLHAPAGHTRAGAHVAEAG